MRNIKLRIISLLLVVAMVMAIPACGKKNEVVSPTTKPKKEETTINYFEGAKETKITLDASKTYQTIESFGASGAWWSQDVGGMTKIQRKSGLETREYIAKLLFDKEFGIGLTNYRYNIGAGSVDGEGTYWHKWRRTECFETAPGVYDWTKDANAVWMLKRAVELGVEEVVLFANSPLQRLTVSGMAQAAEKQADMSNLPRENYEAHAKYLLDVAEHFVSEGIPVKFISPINEPQYDWNGAQEGCHFDKNEVVDILNLFIDKVAERETLKGVEISGAELGSWFNEDSAEYLKAIFADEKLSNYLTTIDSHSYWTDKSTKVNLMSYLKREGLADKIKLRQSEWCEMVNGKDYGMDSAIELAKVLNDDLTILNVTSWQYWIAVSCYDYRDGLIYITEAGEVVVVPKRLWAMGNFSKFVRPGYVRTDSSINYGKALISSYEGTNEAGKDETVVVITNTSVNSMVFDINDISGGSTNVKIYVTDENHNLEDITSSRLVDGKVALSGQSVTTIVIEK